MLPSIDLRIQNLVKALVEVVLPALPPTERLARDQAALVVGHLRMIAEQWKFALRFESQSLDHLLDLAGNLAAADVPMGAELRRRLAASVAKFRSTDRADGNAIETAIIDIGADIDQVIQGDGTESRIPAELMRLVLQYGAIQARRERTWFQGNMLDPGRAGLPSIAEMLAEGAAKT